MSSTAAGSNSPGRAGRPISVGTDDDPGRLIGSITNRMQADRADAARVRTPPCRRASSRDIDGRRTIPSGRPMTPSGIWSTVNATLNAVTAPTASVRRQRRDDEEGDLADAPARSRAAPSAASASRAAGSRGVDARAVAEAERAQRRELDEQVGDRRRRRRRWPGRSTPIDGARSSAAPMIARL